MTFAKFHSQHAVKLEIARNENALAAIAAAVLVLARSQWPRLLLRQQMQVMTLPECASAGARFMSDMMKLHGCTGHPFSDFSVCAAAAMVGPRSGGSSSDLSGVLQCSLVVCFACRIVLSGGANDSAHARNLPSRASLQWQEAATTRRQARQHWHAGNAHH